MRAARAALAFLTRLPVGRLDAADFARAPGWFAAAGLAIGALAAGVWWLAAAVWPPVLAALASVAALALITGALHEDGLADAFDGLGSGRPAERALEIMRDSRIGSYGVLALVLVIGLRASALAALMPGLAGALVVIAGAMASRAVLPIVMAHLPPARTDGLGRSAGSPEMPVWAGALAIGLLALLVFLPFSAWVPALLAGGAAALAVSRMALRQIGGQTGDTLGATQLLTETAILLAAVAAS